MLKIVHLLTGVTALLLSFIPSLRAEAVPYLQQADAIYLTLLGLLNLLLAPQLPHWQGNRQLLQSFCSALLVAAVALQSLGVLAPLSTLAGQPVILLSLLSAAVATLLHVANNFRGETRQGDSFAYSPIEAGSAQGNRETGTVKWFNTSKGFGFISRDTGDDIFVHFRAIRGEGHRILIEGQRVEFSVIQRDKGLQAEDVIAAAPNRR
ncbi:CspA family cold shock protein [Pseudomonas fluvialis]|uniref:CspA family cold shock protein n=1 Tax=Pseudomonas fluvialis TaxID=1793966 RepID=A0A7X0BTB0_9PSED|nr:CspA family cold shock protein [Pseudomonas fluvialis]